MNILPAWMYMHHTGRVCGWLCVHACAYVLTWCWGVPRKGIGSSGTAIMDGCMLSHGFWELNLALLFS